MDVGLEVVDEPTAEILGQQFAGGMEVDPIVEQLMIESRLQVVLERSEITEISDETVLVEIVSCQGHGNNVVVAVVAPALVRLGQPPKFVTRAETEGLRDGEPSRCIGTSF